MPWYFWVLWGIFGIPYILSYVIRSTKTDPILWRIGWGITTPAILILVMIDNLNKGLGYFEDYIPIVNKLSIPLVVITVLLIYIGGYQKSRRPGFDPERRRVAYLSTYLIIVAFIFLGLVFGGVYIYTYFYGK